MAAIPAGAFAQAANTSSAGASQASAASAPEGLAEIVVTANKRSENVQKTPAAVSVVGGEAISSSGLVDATQLTKVVPSLVIARQGPNAVVFLRGVGQTNSTPAAQPGISMNVDGVYLPRELGGSSLFDLERVEVLPGPQGTLYGRNSAGGAVNLVTRKPGTTYSAEGSLEAGNYSLIHGFTAVDVPIVDGLAIRGALDVNKRDGYLSNGADDEDSVAGRFSVSLKPSPTVSALLQYTYIRQGGVGMQFMAHGGDAGPPFGSKSDPWLDTFPTRDLFFRNRGHILTGNFSVDLSDDITLSYIPGYMQLDNHQGLQFNGDSFARFKQDVQQYSQELRLANHGKGRLTWLGGLFWYKARSGIDVQLGAPLGPPFAFVNFRNSLNSYAAFGQATYAATDKLRLTLGGRYSSDKFDGSGFQNVPFFGILTSFGAAKRQGRADWKAGVEYDVAPQSMLYATAQSGYLPGGYTQADSRSNLPKTFNPVKLVALTGGSKNRFLDNRLQINNEVFFYSYKDYQTQTVRVDPVTQLTQFLVSNVPKTDIYGDQLDIVYSVTRDTDLRLSGAYVHAKVTQGFGAARTFEGFDMPNSPKWTINASIEHRFPLSNGGNIAARIASSYNSGYWAVFSEDPYTHQKSFTKTDVSLTYNSPDKRWYLSAWARNLENNESYYGSDAPSSPGNFVPTFIDAPRTYGMRAGFNF